MGFVNVRLNDNYSFIRIITKNVRVKKVKLSDKASSDQ